MNGFQGNQISGGEVRGNLRPGCERGQRRGGSCYESRTRAGCGHSFPLWVFDATGVEGCVVEIEGVRDQQSVSQTGWNAGSPGGTWKCLPRPVPFYTKLPGVPLPSLFSFAPLGLVRIEFRLTHGLRRGLHSFAASRLRPIFFATCVRCWESLVSTCYRYGAAASKNKLW
jgi:hypothetical protein